MTNSVEYSEAIQKIIISNLDGWQIKEVPVPDDGVENIASDVTIEDDSSEDDVEAFMTDTEVDNKANKVITSTECQMFYEEALDMAYMHTNRLNIDDLSEVEARMFIRGVCKWTASNLWNKYNIRVNNEDMEDTYVQSYGGLLYKSALKMLTPFINQRITGLSSHSSNDTDDDDIWII